MSDEEAKPHEQVQNGGRQPIPLDWAYIDKSLQACCSGVSIARDLGIHHETLYNRVQDRYGMSFTDYSTKQREKGDDMLRKAQFEKALDKDNTMLIWLGKNRLRQRDGYTEITISKDQQAAIEKLLAALAPPAAPVIDHKDVEDVKE